MCTIILGGQGQGSTYCNAKIHLHIDTHRQAPSNTNTSEHTLTNTQTRPFAFTRSLKSLIAPPGVWRQTDVSLVSFLGREVTKEVDSSVDIPDLPFSTQTNPVILEGNCTDTEVRYPKQRCPLWGVPVTKAGTRLPLYHRVSDVKHWDVRVAIRCVISLVQWQAPWVQ